MTKATKKGAADVARPSTKRAAKQPKTSYVLIADGQNPWRSHGFVTQASFTKHRANMGTSPLLAAAMIVDSLAYAFAIARALQVWVFAIVDGVVAKEPIPRTQDPWHLVVEAEAKAQSDRVDALRATLQMILNGGGVPRATVRLIEAMLKSDAAKVPT